jgi:hypothetical protein
MRNHTRHRALATLHLGVATVAALATREAHATLPSYLQPGFPMETLDPAPAGDRFVVTPDATVMQSPASVRAVVDFVSNPAKIQVNGNTVSATSTDWYAHFGLSAAPCDYVLLSANLPMVLNQQETLQSPEQGLTGPAAISPSPGDLGDMRVGARFRLTPPRFEHWAIAASADLWFTTGNSDSLTGEPENRFRAMAIANGDFSVGQWTLDLAGAAGYQTFTATASTYGSARGMPIRAAVGLEHPLIGGIGLRGALEFFGTAWGEATGNIDRHTGEGLLSLMVFLGRSWTIGLSEGLGLTDAPGVPGARGIISVQYRTPENGPPATHASAGE